MISVMGVSDTNFLKVLKIDSFNNPAIAGMLNLFKIREKNSILNGLNYKILYSEKIKIENKNPYPKTLDKFQLTSSRKLQHDYC
jgi:hypothetical protein